MGLPEKVRLIYHPELMRMGQAPGASKGRKTVYESWQEILLNKYLPCHADKSLWCKKLSLVTALLHGTGPTSKFFLAVKGEVKRFSWVCWVSAAFGSKESECQDSTFWGGIFCSPLGDTKQSVHSIPYTENRQQCWRLPPPNAIHEHWESRSEFVGGAHSIYSIYIFR